MKRWLSILLLLSMLLGLLASCRQKGGEPTVTTGDDPAPPVVEEGDGWVDNWDTDPTFAPLVNDKELDTNGVKGNGSWFDSFKSSRNLFWVSNGVGDVTYQDGMMKMEASQFSYSGGQSATVSHTAMKADNYELEIRMRIDYFGNDNAFYVAHSGKRAIVYLFESKLRVGIDRSTEGHPKPEFIYTEIGYDWHTYRLLAHDGIVDLYLDGVFLVSFEPEATGAPDGFCISCYPVTQFSPAKYSVEYVSYTVLGSKDLKITSPAAGATCGTGVTDVTVTCDVDEDLVAENETVSFYLNDFFVGTASSETPQITLEDLRPGAYRIYAKCGDTISVERVFYVAAEEEAGASDPLYSTSEKLQSSYILRFSLNGNGAVTAGDGYFPLDLQVTDGTLTYKTLDGDKTVKAGNGDYIVVVDSGASWIYYNGRVITSYRMPYGACGTTVTQSGGVSGMTVEAHNATLLLKQEESGSLHINEDPGYIPYNYAMEFVYTHGNPLDIAFSDGAFYLDLSFGADGVIKGVIAPHLSAYEEVLCTATAGTNLYRVAVYNGIAQLFVNNVWVASWKLARTVSERNLFVEGSGVPLYRISEIEDRFYFSANVGASDWDDYFAVSGYDHSGIINSKLLKVYSKNTELSTTVNITASMTGRIYLVARYFGGAKDVEHTAVVAGYDFTNKQFKIGNNLKSPSVVTTDVTMPTSGTVTLTLRVEGEGVTLLCNGQVVATATTMLNGWGNAGYVCNLPSGAMQSFSFEGDGNPLCDTATNMIQDRHTVCVYELNNKVYIAAEGGYVYTSNNGGDTFSSPIRHDYLDYNTIILKSGKILTLKRIIESDGMKYYRAYVSSDGGKTYYGYSIHSDKNTYRFTMNGKVMQTSSGRLIFVSGETENENIGMLWIYYSDNEGVTWKKSKSIFNHKTTGMNLQEGAVVELEGGVLRMYARNDGGFLVYSDSHDNGKTWSMDMQYSNFASVVSAFGVSTDLSTGAIYLAWEYNCVNDAATIQYPRTRVGLAASYNSGKTWEYIGDIDEANQLTSVSWTHMNIGMWVTSKSVFVTVAKQVGSTWYNYMVRVGKETIVPSVRFNGLHTPLREPTDSTEGTRLWMNNVLAISPSQLRVYASGVTFDIAEVKGKRTMLTTEMLAAFLNGTCETENGVSTVRVGNVSFVFTADAQTALINGEEKEMIFAAVLNKDGTVAVSIEDLDALLGLTVRQASNGAIVITTDPSPVRLEYILAQVGVW